jgi:hypothetical protein
MKGFEKVWSSASSIVSARGGEAALPDLKPLLLRVHNDVATSPVNLPALKNGLVELLRYLNDEGRTSANCWTADLFFCSDEWEA